jgi:hypothetical protein
VQHVDAQRDQDDSESDHQPAAADGTRIYIVEQLTPRFSRPGTRQGLAFPIFRNAWPTTV